MSKQEIERIKADIAELKRDVRMIYDRLSGETGILRSEMEAAFALVSKKLEELRELREGSTT
jgi:hypothetical protein